MLDYVKQQFQGRLEKMDSGYIEWYVQHHTALAEKSGAQVAEYYAERIEIAQDILHQRTAGEPT